LNNAIKTQSDEYQEVKHFLTAIKLDKYLDKFVENGLEDEETILELKDEHIEVMGIPLGHKLKILKRIKEVREDKGMTPSLSRQGTIRDEIQYSDSISSRPLTHNVYEELPDPSTSMST
jgi:hypothetical protein